ncbi:hypothetical protein BTO06_12790 [Tenacibaculum sp. SZ-18]|nr:hypothetical protein BTO06_12790 [Tenacibaculum sp. SZ-18]
MEEVELILLTHVREFGFLNINNVMPGVMQMDMDLLFSMTVHTVVVVILLDILLIFLIVKLELTILQAGLVMVQQTQPIQDQQQEAEEVPQTILDLHQMEEVTTEKH